MYGFNHKVHKGDTQRSQSSVGFSALRQTSNQHIEKFENLKMSRFENVDSL